MVHAAHPFWRQRQDAGHLPSRYHGRQQHPHPLECTQERRVSVLSWQVPDVSAVRGPCPSPWQPGLFYGCSCWLVSHGECMTDWREEKTRKFTCGVKVLCIPYLTLTLPFRGSHIYGWRREENSWRPFWTTMLEAATACRELLRCGCKSQPLCSRKCKCHEASLLCTALCHCGGNC